MSCGMSSGGQVGQAMVSQTPVYDNGHKPRRSVYSRKAGVYRPTKKHRKPRFL
jgi:hypothetical protein